MIARWSLASTKISQVYRIIYMKDILDFFLEIFLTFFQETPSRAVRLLIIPGIPPDVSQKITLRIPPVSLWKIFQVILSKMSLQTSPRIFPGILPRIFLLFLSWNCSRNKNIFCIDFRSNVLKSFRSIHLVRVLVYLMRCLSRFPEPSPSPLWAWRT